MQILANWKLEFSSKDSTYYKDPLAGSGILREPRPELALEEA